MDDGFEVVKLEYEVKIACISAELEKSILLDIFKLFLDNRTSFISYTKSGDEVSIIIDRHSLDISELGHIGAINIEPTIYKVLQIFENYSGIDHIGIVSKLSKIFFENNIPILYINSYNYNYILYPTLFDKIVDTLISGLENKNEI